MLLKLAITVPYWYDAGLVICYTVVRVGHWTNRGDRPTVERQMVEQGRSKLQNVSQKKKLRSLVGTIINNIHQPLVSCVRVLRFFALCLLFFCWGVFAVVSSAKVFAALESYKRGQSKRTRASTGSERRSGLAHLLSGLCRRRRGLFRCRPACEINEQTDEQPCLCPSFSQPFFVTAIVIAFIFAFVASFFSRSFLCVYVFVFFVAYFLFPIAGKYCACGI